MVCVARKQKRSTAVGTPITLTSCFADDTNMVHRENLAADRRKLITDTQQDFGGVIHPGKWQHLRAMREKIKEDESGRSKSQKETTNSC